MIVDIYSNIAILSRMHMPPHMDHRDPSLNIFFRVDNLKVGKTMPIRFVNEVNTFVSPLSSPDKKPMQFLSPQYNSHTLTTPPKKEAKAME
ncbi:hypothetical protein SLE2022_145250 [Rubroshorea leprosula]